MVYLIPASDMSEQILTAGYEASGTSNMKFMMNGATIEMAAPETRAAFDLIARNHFSRKEPGIFTPILDALLNYGDHYRHLAGLPSYTQAHQRPGELYTAPLARTRKVILNIAASGRFFSNRTIAEYAKEIWNTEPFLNGQLNRDYLTPFLRKNIMKNSKFSCTFPAQLCKLLKLNGAGDGNRTHV